MVFGCEPVFLKKNDWMCGLFGIGILLRLGVGVSVVQLEGYLYHSIASREMLGFRSLGRSCVEQFLEQVRDDRDVRKLYV
jgi:hypothetical protein